VGTDIDMIYLVGVVLIAAGVGQIALRTRMARANAASNRVMFNGHLGGEGWQSYSRAMSIIVGAVFIAAGVAALAGVFHMR
jgi:hypothetical protein